jgi:hypothetical protein
MTGHDRCLYRRRGDIHIFVLAAAECGSRVPREVVLAHLQRVVDFPALFNVVVWNQRAYFPKHFLGEANAGLPQALRHFFFDFISFHFSLLQINNQNFSHNNQPRFSSALHNNKAGTQ